MPKDIRFLAVDIEARPGPWAGADFTFRNMLSIAAVYQDEPGKYHYLAPGFKAQQFAGLLSVIQRPGQIIVTHNGFRYDLPFLNGTAMKLLGENVRPLRVSDTKDHTGKHGYAFSKSLGNMARRFEAECKKGGMSEYEWEAAYEREKWALDLLKEYNIGDCLTTLALRDRLLHYGLLGHSTMWRP